MWGSFLDKGRELAEKAKKAAEDLDKQLNESVGNAAGSETQSSLTGALLSATGIVTSLETESADELNDDWDEDKDNLLQSPENDYIAVISTDASDVKNDSLQMVDGDETPDGTHKEQVGCTEEGWKEGEGDLTENFKLAEEQVPNKSINEVSIVNLVNENSDVAESLSVPTCSISNNPSEILTDESQQNFDDNNKEWIDDGEMEAVGPTHQIESLENGFPTDTCAVEMPMTSDPSIDESFLDSNESIFCGIDVTIDEPCVEIDPNVTHEVSSTDPDANNPASYSNGEAETGRMMDEDEQQEILTPNNSTKTEDITRFMEQQAAYTKLMEQQMDELSRLLEQREMQLMSKSEELTLIESAFETERQELQQKLQSTKDEAKRRIAVAKERVEAMERQVNNVTANQSSTIDSMSQKDEIITALRMEGEKLARKQADMEKAVRSAKSEARELRTLLEETTLSKDDGLERISALEELLAGTKEALSSARQGEHQAEKLESELRQVRDESERRQATIISMEQQQKELKLKVKDLQTELEEARKGAAVESEHERKKLMKEQQQLVKDLENTIRVTEREAAMREDALRHEVEELRKRWQDSVRRADSLAIDIQSSTAPLLRQLDSLNKQNRTRATASAELETQLRSELEENVILNEKLVKERNDWKTKFSRVERMYKELEEETKRVKKSIEEKQSRGEKLERELQQMEEDSVKMKEQWAEVERIANEGVSRVRSEMTRTVVESEERYRAQIENLKVELVNERDMRNQLSQQVEGLLENAGLFTLQEIPTQTAITEDVKPRKLRQTEGQASILASTLGGLVDESDGEDIDTDFDENDEPPRPNSSSFAALDQLTSSLKAAKNELLILRKRLQESEKAKEGLLESLAECRSAKEKLPLFESKVKELTEQNLELSNEIQGLREDIADVRELYRTQLNVLLEEKALSKNEINSENTGTPGKIVDDEQGSTEALKYDNINSQL
jgi:hypothetical protein